jgi:Ni,Fe-hydrogenase III large subunit
MPDEPEWSGFVVANKMHENKGFAAVESPRGRLYYLVTATADGRLADARVLAPTDWNFHPQGPFARALAGFRPVGDPITAITGLAKFFCPCVALTTEVDAADA